MAAIIDRFDSWDKTLSNTIAQRFSQREIASFFAKSGDNGPWMLLCGVFFVYNMVMPRSFILFHLFAIGITALITQILKLSIKRQRPHGEVFKYTSKRDVHSFPSGHSSRMGVLTVLMYFAFPNLGWIFIIW